MVHALEVPFDRDRCGGLRLAGRRARRRRTALRLPNASRASDFIANAARSRDAGISAAAFLGHMEEDFELIQSFPSDLRWFVHDPDDEAFLLASAREVFAHPSTPESHRQQFLQSCVDRMAG